MARGGRGKWATTGRGGAGVPITDLHYPPPDGGGGSAPDWVPVNAKIHIDFLGGTSQGRAWTETDGEVAIDALLGSDPDTGNGWAATSYDPTKLAANGYVPTVPFALLNAARTKILLSATVVLRLMDLHGVSDAPEVVLLSASGNNTFEFISRGGPKTFKATSWHGPLSLETAADIKQGIGLFNQYAFTLVPDRVDIVVNGGIAVTSALTVDDYPISGDMVNTSALIDLMTAQNFAIQFITLYDPLPDTTGLSELSAVG